MSEKVNAFTDGPKFRIAGAAEGPLSGLEFVAKDLFDVAGYVTGGGNPDWANRQGKATHHAWAVQCLLDAGAALIGKTITDEVSLGILGENAFYGTPLNTAAPDRVPGGSSSGTAAAVGAGLADFGLGTDTGGSVRVPASFCGLYGIRPTHGRLDLSGMLPQAPSSDTCGWLAKDAAVFRRISTVLLQEPLSAPKIDRVIIASDAFGFAETETMNALAPLIGKLTGLVSTMKEDILAPQGLSVWGRAQRTLQPAEAYETFKEWLDTCNPRLAFNVARGLLYGAAIPESERQWAELMRREARARLTYLLPPGTALAMPTTPFPAPLKDLPLREQNPIREAILCLCAHGGLAGMPQVSIPGAMVDGAPVGLSLVAGANEDAALVALACALGESL